MGIKLGKDEINRLLEIESQKFSTYVSPIINLANYYAHGTRPEIVGQLTDLIQEFQGRSLTEWEKWYLEQEPTGMQNATIIIMQKLKEFKNVIEKIDQNMVGQWVRDLVIVKTFIGLKFQEAILKKGAEIKRTGYRLANPDEESKGIDGFIGNCPVSIKPETYKLKASLPESINTKIIYYEKVKDGIKVDFKEII